jgi:hypothetical protein
MARAQGCVGIGPIVKRTLLDEAVRRGVDQVREGKIVVIDVRVMRGYGGAMPKTVLRESE